MSLFSYPSTREAYAAPKRHRVTVAADHEGSVQFTLERGSRSFRPGQTVELTDFEMTLIDPDLFDQGILTKTGGINNAVGTDSGVSVQEFEIALPDVADGTVASFDAPFDGSIVAWDFIVTEAVTTGGDTTTLTVEIEGAAVQGTGDATLVVDSATATPKGAIIAGEAPASANDFTAGDTIEVVAASTAAFAEGAGVVRLTLVEA